MAFVRDAAVRVKETPTGQTKTATGIPTPKISDQDM